MSKSKWALIAAAISIALGVIGSIVKEDLKGMVCGTAAASGLKD